MAERTVRAQARLAVEAGATVREETAVEAIHPGGDGGVESHGPPPARRTARPWRW